MPRFGRGRGWGAGGILAVAIVVAALLVALTSFYSVETDEVGVVLRFGKFHRTEEPGLHTKIPLGVEQVYPVRVRHVFKEEFGFKTTQPGIVSQFSTDEFLDQSLILTGDLNMVKLEWIVQYRIKDPVAYAFRVRNVEGTIRYGAEAIMRKVMGDVSFDEAITTGDELAPVVQDELQSLFDEYGLGIDVELVKMQTIRPPTEVLASFDDVNKAQQERETLVNQSRKAYNEAIPAERGRAQAAIKTAEGYAIDRVNRAKGDAERFVALLDEYRKAPVVTERRLYLETLAEVLPRLEKKMVVDEKAGALLPLMPWPAGGGAVKLEEGR